MIQEFCDWLSRTPLSIAFQEAGWFVPTVQTIHIIAIAILLTTLYLIGLKLLGFMQRSQSLSVSLRKASPWIWIMLTILLLSGALLTITEPARELLNWAFRLKMIMVLILALVVAWVQGRVRLDPDYWTRSPGRRGLAKVLGVFVLIVGAAIITAGRWIAYV